MNMTLWWKQFHWPEYGAELLGTAILVFVGLSAVVFNFSTTLPISHLIPNSDARRLITGLLFAGSGSLVAISPLGKLSGAHINPSVSLAFWVHRKLHTLDFVGYVVGQFVGALLGALLLALVWQSNAANVKYGTTFPGAGYPLWFVFLAEMCLTLLLVLLIFLFVSSHTLMRWTPVMTWIVVAAMVWLEAPISGTSLNPARSFGPALVAGLWDAQWLYFVAPPLGAVIAVGLFRIITAGERDVLTGKLFHVPHYRSVFKHVSAPHMPADGKLRKKGA